MYICSVTLKQHNMKTNSVSVNCGSHNRDIDEKKSINLVSIAPQNVKKTRKRYTYVVSLAKFADLGFNDERDYIPDLSRKSRLGEFRRYSDAFDFISMRVGQILTYNDNYSLSQRNYFLAGLAVQSCFIYTDEYYRNVQDTDESPFKYFLTRLPYEN